MALTFWSSALPLLASNTFPLAERTLIGSALGKSVQIYEDSSANKSIQDIVHMPNEQWKLTPNSTPNFGFTASAYWVRFTVSNRQQFIQDWMLEVGYPMIDSITLFTPESGVFLTSTMGDHFPFYERDIAYRHCIFNLREPPISERTYYLRFRTTSSMNIPLYAWSPTALTDAISREQIIMGLYYGALLVMLIYNFLLLLGIRDINYLYYVFFIAGQIMYQFTLNGLSFQYLWQSAIWWANNSLPCFMGFATFWAVFFARSFLNARANAPHFEKLYLIVLPILAVSAASSLFLPYSYSIKATTFLAMIIAPFLILNAILEWRHGYEPAKYFAISWIAFIVGVMLYTMKTFGWIPSNVFTNLTLQIGSLLQVVLLSLALVGKFNVMRRENYRARQELITAQMKTLEGERARQDAEIYRLRNVELAQAYRDVEQKNAEMLRLNESLRELNTEKNELVGIVAHDLKNPLSNISMLAKVLQTEAGKLRTEDVEEYASDIRTASERMFELITNLLDIHAIENKALRINSVPFNIAEIVRHIINEYHSRAEAKQIHITLEIPANTMLENTLVVADRTLTIQILDNLLSNAVKYSPLGKNITISLRKQGTSVCCDVQDEGPGLTDEDKKRLFGKFARLSARPTAGEHSTGLGLSIAKKLARAMDGDISCISTAGKGSTFTLCLPTSDDTTVNKC